MTENDHAEYIAKHAQDLDDQLATFRDREFGDIKGTYDGDIKFPIAVCNNIRYSVEWRAGGVRYSYSGTEHECISYIEGYMDGYHEGRR